MVFTDGTHIKASANKKKYRKEQAAKTAKVYAQQLQKEVSAEREKPGKPPVEKEDDDSDSGGGGTAEKTVSTTGPACGMFVKGDHERQFAYEAHTACDQHGFVLGVEVAAGNVRDSIAWDALYAQVTERLSKTERGKDIYALRKHTVERVFADAKDKQGMRYTSRRGLARVSSGGRLKFAAFNLKNLAIRAANSLPSSPALFRSSSSFFFPFSSELRAFLRMF